MATLMLGCFETRSKVACRNGITRFWAPPPRAGLTGVWTVEGMALVASEREQAADGGPHVAQHARTLGELRSRDAEDVKCDGGRNRADQDVLDTRMKVVFHSCVLPCVWSTLYTGDRR